MPNTMYQVSTLQALMMGDYEGHISIRALLKKGDTGLGTFDSLHGEMILLDGICYRALEDGHVEVSQEEDRSPFAVASFLKSVPLISLRCRRRSMQDAFVRERIISTFAA